MITVKELAKKCGVSQQSIRNYCISHNVKKQAQGKKQLVFCIDEETESAIIQYYTEKAENTSTRQETHKASTSSELVCALQSQIESLNNQLNVKDHQISVKDKLIEQQQKTIQVLTEQLTIAQQLTAGTTKALLTEQEQHKSDVEILSEEKSNVETHKNNVPVQTQDEQHEEVKTKVAEPEPVKAEQEPTEQEEQPQKKQGFFSRLFKRK